MTQKKKKKKTPPKKKIPTHKKKKKKKKKFFYNKKNEKKKRQINIMADIHNYCFPKGEPLAKNIEEMTKIVFNKVTILNKLPNQEIIEKTGLDAILTVQLKASKLELIVEESVWRAIGKHYLSVHVSFLDKNLNKIFEDELAVEGKNLDLIDYETEGGWWKISGPKYGPAVEDSIEKLVFKLAQRLIAFREKITIK